MRFLYIFTLIVLYQFSSNACTCDTVSFEEALVYADEIFVGRIVRAESIVTGSYFNEENEEMLLWTWEFEFEVSKKWKGNHNSRLILGFQATSCDYYFDIYDREYLVYATRTVGKETPLGVSGYGTSDIPDLSTWLCSRTVNNAFWDNENWFEEDTKRLNKNFPDEIFLFNYYKVFLLVISCILTILLILLFFYLRRKIKRNINSP